MQLPPDHENSRARCSSGCICNTPDRLIISTVLAGLARASLTDADYDLWDSIIAADRR